MGKMSPDWRLADRRRGAREAGQDQIDAHLLRSHHVRAIEAAIEAATRVRITPEIREAMVREMTATLGNWEKSLAAAFRAAGFEVVE